MLKKISCNIFLQKEIVFHEGLNAIVGDDIASNSIGKSTMLMIIDFVFGGDDYISKNHDVVDNLGHHDFRFIFNFDNKDYYFIRSTNEYKFVSICNEKFEILQSVTTEEFTAWLQEKYDCQLESLTFRNIVGRYFRIYGKENLNERKPIQYFEKETAPKSILALLKLFDKYKSLKAYEEQIEKLKSDKTTLVDAAKKNFLPNVNTKSLFNKNEKKIEELSVRLEKIKKEIVTTSLDLESMVSQEILKLKREKSQLTIKLNSYQSRLLRTQNNIKNKPVKISAELEQFVYYFPDFNVEQVNKVEDFHKNINKILKSELVAVEKELKAKIEEINNQIIEIDKEIEQKLSIKDAPKLAVDGSRFCCWLYDEQIISFEVVERIKLWDYLINLKELKRKRIIENFRLKIVLTLPALPATMCWRGISLYYTFLTMRTGIGSFYAAKTIRKKMREWFL